MIKTPAMLFLKGILMTSLIVLGSLTITSCFVQRQGTLRYTHKQVIRSSGELPYYAAWSRHGGWTGDNYYRSVWANGSAVYCTGAGGGDLVLVRYSENGTRIWNRTWGGPSSDSGMEVYGAGDVVFTCGTTASFGTGGVDSRTDMVLVKWDGNGNQIWNRTWGRSISDDFGQAIWANATAIFTLVYTTTYEVGGTDLVLVRWDHAGNQTWNRTFGGGGTDIWGDGVNIFTCGGSLLIKWSGAGGQIWNHTFNPPGGEAFNGIWGADGHVYTAGNTDEGMLLVKWNATSGAQVWNRTGVYMPNVNFFSVTGDGSGSLYTFSLNYIDSALVLAKWNVDGNCTWSRLKDAGSLYIIGLGVTFDGTHIYSCGYYQRYWPGGLDALLIKWAPNTVPSITAPADLDYTFGTSGNAITWIVNDTSVETPTYQVFRNGTLDKADTWANSVPIVVNVDSLAVGSCNCTIDVSDGAGGMATDTVIVTVSFPTTLVITIAASAGAGCLIVASIAIKRKKQRNPKISPAPMTGIPPPPQLPSS